MEDDSRGMTRCSSSGLLGLPPELACVLVTDGFLQPTEAMTVRRVCRALRQLVESETAAPYWRSLSTARWPIYRAAMADARPGTPVVTAPVTVAVAVMTAAVVAAAAVAAPLVAVAAPLTAMMAPAQQTRCSIRWWRVLRCRMGSVAPSAGTRACMD